MEIENNIQIPDVPPLPDLGCPPGQTCSWGGINNIALCSPGNGDCIPDVNRGLLVAELSKFHDEILIAATQAINEILTGIPADPQGRQLSFLVTKMGILLAWVEHGVPVPKDAVTYDDDNATVAAALGLIDWESAIKA